MPETRRTRRTKQNQTKKTKSNKKGRIWKKIGLTLFFIIVLISITLSGLFFYYASTTPKISAADLQGATETQIFDMNQELITKLGGENRDLIEPEEVPQGLKDAITSIEDKRYYSHLGIDPIRIVGSFVRNLRAGHITQGGSTITQQLIKLSVFSTKKEDQTYKRKIQEILLALQIEREFSKEQILTYYLNKVYMANNTYGFGTAANYYFGKELKELTIPQLALLAGMPQAPSSYDPYAHPEQAQERRDIVLQSMKDNGKLTDAQLQEAKATPITEGLIAEHEQVSTDDNRLIFDSFLTMVADEVKEKTGLDVYSDGLTIETTVNSQAQNHLYEILNTNHYVQYVDDNVQNAVVMLDSTTGAVRAINGGRKQTNLLAYNRAVQNDRSTGSTIKPIMDYGPAIEYLNYSTGQTMVDKPTTYSSGFELNNWDNQFMGTMTMRKALVLSRNTPAYQTFKAVGNDNIQAFLKKLELSVTNDGKESLVESNSIGANLSPLKMAAAYSAFANYGTYSKPYTVTKITTRDGQVLQFKPDQHQAMKDSTAYMITNMLKDTFTYGFANDLRMGNLPHAAKTGSTNYTPEQRKQLGASDSEFVIPDSWFIGYSPAYTISVWTGYDNPYTKGHGLSQTEANYSKWIYGHLMNFAMKQTPVKDWEQPSSVVSSQIVVGSNPLALAGPNTPADKVSIELFVKGAVPTQQYVEEKIAPPSGLNVSYDATKKEVTVTWNAVKSDEEKPKYTISVGGQTQTVDKTTATFKNIAGESVTISLTVTIKDKTSDPVTHELKLGTKPEEKEKTSTITNQQNPQQPQQPAQQNGQTTQAPVRNEVTTQTTGQNN
ncbi:PBP1A family penicillin-binding protein [uncultured Granulicatella sp.]|uniref:transglycosylase domain-containing protein n=1 Tax=uncultured Granulicatella sp. TaxID=316089 RepID=UPI0028E62373|nr:PBP1A family penicillin-binding protein [uncultured Granulicatella sp.]